MSNAYIDVVKKGVLPLADESLKEFSKSLLENQKIIAALKPFKPKVRRFIIAKACGSSMDAAARIAGYTGANARIGGYKLLQREGVADAVALVEMEAAFSSGIPAWMKRRELWQFWLDNKDSSQAASVSAMKLLAALDGDIEAPNSAGGGLVINIHGLGSVGTVIEGESDRDG